MKFLYASIIVAVMASTASAQYPYRGYYDYRPRYDYSTGRSWGGYSYPSYRPYGYRRFNGFDSRGGFYYGRSYGDRTWSYDSYGNVYYFRSW